MNKDYVTQNDLNVAMIKQKKFYWSDQYYSSGETVQGTGKVKLEVFGDIDIEVPRDGLYEVTAYIYCYTSSGNSSYYLYMDNVAGSNNATILGQEPQAHPLATTFMLTKGTHRLNVYANSSSGSREFILATYYVSQLIVKEI